MVSVFRSTLQRLIVAPQPEINFGLVICELKLRALVRRTLIVTPKSLAPSR